MARLAGLEQLRGKLHRLDDLHVAGAAADVAPQGPADFVLRRARVAAEQAGRGHDEAGRAVAALGAELLVKAALDRGERAARSERLDGIDALAGDGRCEREAR